jgi:hypothetical protein
VFGDGLGFVVVEVPFSGAGARVGVSGEDCKGLEFEGGPVGVVVLGAALVGIRDGIGILVFNEPWGELMGETCICFCICLILIGLA